ncbi:hypothetical protein [Sphingomonas floccifaciens]
MWAPGGSAIDQPSTESALRREGGDAVMNVGRVRRILLIGLLTGFVAACDRSQDQAGQNFQPPEPTIQMPPSIAASHTFRCKDNSLVYVDFFSDRVTASLRTEKSGPPIRLVAPAKGEPFTGEGYVLVGSDTSITLSKPGTASQACKA